MEVPVISHRVTTCPGVCRTERRADAPGGLVRPAQSAAADTSIVLSTITGVSKIVISGSAP